MFIFFQVERTDVSLSDPQDPVVRGTRFPGNSYHQFPSDTLPVNTDFTGMSTCRCLCVYQKMDGLSVSIAIYCTCRSVCTCKHTCLCLLVYFFVLFSDRNAVSSSSGDIPSE